MIFSDNMKCPLPISKNTQDYYRSEKKELLYPINKQQNKLVAPQLLVLGTLINFRNMKRVNTRGIQQANKHVLLAALTYNLHKYLRFLRQERKTSAHAMNISTKSMKKGLKTLLLSLFILTGTIPLEIARVNR